MPTYRISIDNATQDHQLTPAQVGWFDMHLLLGHLNDAIREVALRSQADIEPSHLFSLIGVEQGSCVYLLDAPDPVAPAADEVTRAIAQDDYNRLPRVAHEAVRTIWKRQADLGREVTIAAPRHTAESFARIRPSHEVPQVASRPTISGVTTVYGHLLRVGGVRPRARLRLSHGGFLSASITQAQARQLAPRLYTDVGLEGEASWSAFTGELEALKVQRLSPYEGLSGADALAELARNDGDHWRGIDADAYVRHLREGE